MNKLIAALSLTLLLGLNQNGLASDFSTLDHYAFDQNQNVFTNGLVIYHEGQIVFEKYANGFTQNSPHISYSMGKTITSLLFGIAENEGVIHRDESIARLLKKYYVHLGSPDIALKDQIRFTDLLQMASGMSWDETYAPTQASNVVDMLYYSGLANTGAYAITRPQATPPQQTFNYSSGESNILSLALKEALRERYREFPWKKLFNPLGIKSATFERDLSGSFIGSSYLYMTPRDYLKIGVLMLQNGNWAGKQIVPKEYLDFARSPSPQYAGYGAQIWLSKNSYSALGFEGQFIIVIPEHKTVIVRTGRDQKGGLSKNLLIKLTLDALNIANLDAESTLMAQDVPIALQTSDPVQMIGANFQARSICSCLFVMKQSPQYCETWSNGQIPSLPWKLNERLKTVFVIDPILPSRTLSQATYHGKNSGCSF
jgi:CubicO group peptidase (beta-lactamase class C family)